MVTNYTRRQFLLHASVGLGLTGTLGCRARWDDRGPPGARVAREDTVAVVGAGLAGLVAANALVDVGAKVVILEGRSTPGGRIRTVRDPFACGIHAELGPWRIPAEHDLVRDYARKFSLKLEHLDRSYRSVCYFVRGSRFDDEDIDRDSRVLPYDLTEEERGLGPIGLWNRAFAPYLDRGLDAYSPDWPRDLSRLDRLSLEDFLRWRGLSEEALCMVGDMFGIRPFYHTAFLANLREELFASSAGFLRIRGGNDQLPGRMAENLGNRILYGWEVSALEQTSDGVTLRATCGGDAVALTVRRAILTVPAPVLQRMIFDPALASDKQSAIREVLYEDATKLFLQCPVSYLSEVQKGRYREYRTDLPIQSVLVNRFPSVPEKGLVTAYAMGTLRMAEDTDPSGLKSRLLAQADRLCPGLSQQVEQSILVQWSQDHYALGAYPVFLPGQESRLHRALARPVGKIHFAGDYTSITPGWMYGAITSGERAAREVFAASQAEGHWL